MAVSESLICTEHMTRCASLTSPFGFEQRVGFTKNQAANLVKHLGQLQRGCWLPSLGHQKKKRMLSLRLAMLKVLHLWLQEKRHLQAYDNFAGVELTI